MVTSRAIVAAADVFGTVQSTLAALAPAVDGAPGASAAIAEGLESAGRRITGQLQQMHALAPEYEEVGRAAVGLAETAPSLLVMAGAARAGAPSDPESARIVSAAVRQVAEAESLLQRAAYAARGAEARAGTAHAPPPSDPVAARLVSRLPPVPGPAAQRRELDELHHIAARRTPEQTARMTIIGKFGHDGVWKEYLRLFALEHPARAAAAELAMQRSLDLAYRASEQAKLAAARPRPFVADPSLATTSYPPATGSWPSGHSVRATAAAETMSAWWPERAAEFRSLARDVGDSRLYAAVHYPSDVAAGEVLGRVVAEHVRTTLA